MSEQQDTKSRALGAARGRILEAKGSIHEDTTVAGALMALYGAAWSARGLADQDAVETVSRMDMRNRPWTASQNAIAALDVEGENNHEWLHADD